MRRPPVAASIATLCVVLLLCALGAWQVQRLHWKENLLVQLDHAYADPAPPFFTSAMIAENATRDFAAARLQGEFIPGRHLLLGIRTWDGQPGYHLIAPLRLRDGGMVLINRGWVPVHPPAATLGSPAGTVTLRGILHRPDRSNPFVPPNDPARQRWYRWDLPLMARALGQDRLAPMILYDLDTGVSGSPVTAALHWTLPNSHLGYALFWFGMAGALIVVYVLRFLR